MENEDPIKGSIKYLVECGWTEEQAKHLIRAIYDKSGERLWEMAPLWVEHCGMCKKYVDSMLGTVALGIVKVSRSTEEDAWLFSLNEEGLKVGKEMFGEEA